MTTYSLSLQMRDAIKKIARNQINTMRPNPRIGEVHSYDPATLTANVIFRGDTVPLKVKYGRGQKPFKTKMDTADGSAPGDIVRVGGAAGSYFILQVLDQWQPAVVNTGGGGATGTVGFKTFPIESYGAVQDGVADDTLALQNALTAAYNAGGGLVTFWGRVKIMGSVTVWRGTTLQGMVRVDANDDNPSNTIIMGSATARLNVGQGNRGGQTGNFLIECNGSGDPTGVLVFSAVWQDLGNIHVDHPAGIGLKVLGQNCHIHDVDVEGAGTDGLVVDDGAGGLKFTRCSFDSSTGWDIRVTETTPGGHPAYGYQYGPAHILFDTCITENYQVTDCQGLVLIEAGTRVTFQNHGFSNSNDCTFLSGYQVVIKNDKFAANVGTSAEFDSCNFHGGNTKKYPPFYVQGTNTAKNVLVVNGYTAYQFATSIYNTDGASIGNIGGYASYTQVTAIFGALAGANWFYWGDQVSTGRWYRMPNATGAWAGVHPLMIGRDNEVGARLMIASDGGLYWCSGANFTPLATLTYDTANGVLAISGSNNTGRQVVGETAFTIPSAAYALTTVCNTGGPWYFYSLGGANTIASWTLSNAVDKQEIGLSIYRAGAQTFVWPTNIRWANNTAPAAPTALTHTRVRLRYNAGAAVWYEIDRSENVPLT